MLLFNLFVFLSSDNNLEIRDNESTVSSELNDEQERVFKDLQDIFGSDFSDDDPTYVFPSVETKTKRKRSVSETSSSSNNQTENIEENCQVLENVLATVSQDLSHKGTPESSQKVLKRWKKANPENWKPNIIKKRRSECLPYVNLKNKSQRAKIPKTVDCSKCNFKCQDNFDEEQRELICANYWRMADYKRQKDFILSCVQSCTPKRRATTPLSSKKPRSNAKKYYFVSQNNKIRVCQKFFLTTLCVSHGVVDNAIEHKNSLGMYSGEDVRGRREPINKTKPDVIEFLKKHIESFPKMESHYGRKSSKRLYLDSQLSISKMYRMYKNKCEEVNMQPASEITYRRIFGNEYNLSFFIPKKDQCATCTAYMNAKGDEKLLQESKYSEHQDRIKDCNEAKSTDKDRSNNEKTFHSLTFDLQSVLQIPCSEVSSLYYSRKINAYNLTIYEASLPNNAYCFAWTELNGKKGSSEIGSCLLEYLQNCLPDDITHVTLFSDTTGGQNRNQNLAALFTYAVQNLKNVEIIEQKFLEPGHTYMEVDSMHSCIESAKKFVPVYCMQDWLSILRIARSKGKYGRIKKKQVNKSPYSVKEMKFDDFFDLKNLANKIVCNRNRDTSGQIVRWLKIKCLKYVKNEFGKIYFKYMHSDTEYRCLNIFESKVPLTNRRSGRRLQTTTVEEPGISEACELPNLIKLYKGELPISVLKKKDLLNLCKKGIIPKELHGWYENLVTAAGIVDRVPEPAHNESEPEEEQ